MELVTEISPERTLELIDKCSRWIVERRMASAAIMFIESVRPLHNIGAQLMYFVMPAAELFFSPREYQEFAVLLEKQDNVRRLINRIEELDEEYYEGERAKAHLKRKARRERWRTYFKGLLKKK